MRNYIVKYRMEFGKYQAEFFLHILIVNTMLTYLIYHNNAPIHAGNLIIKQNANTVNGIVEEGIY